MISIDIFLGTFLQMLKCLKPEHFNLSADVLGYEEAVVEAVLNRFTK